MPIGLLLSGSASVSGRGMQSGRDFLMTEKNKEGSLFGRVVPLPLVDEIKESYLNYAMSVIVGRALPDVRDGLKPVQRRVLYGATFLIARKRNPWSISHGAYKFMGEAKLDFDRLEKIARLLPGFPIVLHGASSVPQEFVNMANQYGAQIGGAKGVPEELLRRAAASAVCKINIDTDIRLAMTTTIRKYFSCSIEAALSFFNLTIVSDVPIGAAALRRRPLFMPES